MLKRLLILLIFLGFLVPVGAETPGFIKAFKPSGYVNNFSIKFPKFLSKDEQNYLEAKLTALSNTGKGEIAIAVVDDFYGLDANEFSTTLFNHWKIGNKGVDNGVLITIKPTKTGSGRAIYISTGYGAESFVTDALAKRIIEQEIKPEFIKSKFFEGLDKATTSLANLLNGGEPLDLVFEGSRREKNTALNDYLLSLLVIVWIFLFVFRAGHIRHRNSDLLLGSMLLGSSHHGSSSFGGFGGGGFSGGFGGGFSGGGGAGGSW